MDNQPEMKRLKTGYHSYYQDNPETELDGPFKRVPDTTFPKTELDISPQPSMDYLKYGNPSNMATRMSYPNYSEVNHQTSMAARMAYSNYPGTTDPANMSSWMGYSNYTGVADPANMTSRMAYSNYAAADHAGVNSRMAYANYGVSDQASVATRMAYSNYAGVPNQARVAYTNYPGISDQPSMVVRPPYPNYAGIADQTNASARMAQSYDSGVVDHTVAASKGWGSASLESTPTSSPGYFNWRGNPVQSENSPAANLGGYSGMTSVNHEANNMMSHQSNSVDFTDRGELPHVHASLKTEGYIDCRYDNNGETGDYESKIKMQHSKLPVAYDERVSCMPGMASNQTILEHRGIHLPNQKSVIVENQAANHYPGFQSHGVMLTNDTMPGKNSPSNEISKGQDWRDIVNAYKQEKCKTEALPVPIYDGDIADKVLEIEDKLCQALNHLLFTEPVTHIYNPLIYASETHQQYVKKYCTSVKPILFLGMNPGPFGMAQNGVPFGEVSYVRDWLNITGNVNQPINEHPKRPIHGLQSTRSEVSGLRFWRFFKALTKTPEMFFKYCYVHNYCPLVFMSKTGKNVTPPTLNVAQRAPLMTVCDTSLCETIQLLQVKVIIGVGRFAQERAKHALKERGLDDIRIEFLMHPSPINPLANKCWDSIATQQLADIDVLRYLT